MLRSIVNKIIAMPLWINLAGIAVAATSFSWVKDNLDKSYTASNHPVDYVTGQTSFTGETIKGYYAHMQEAGTLDVYWTTQLIDFGFIVSLFFLGAFVGSLLARLSLQGSWGHRLGVLAAMLVMSGATFDVVENLISFVMLNDPLNFANWIAVPYSGFAVMKFASIALGMFAIIGSALFLIVGKLLSFARTR